MVKQNHTPLLVNSIYMRLSLTPLASQFLIFLVKCGGIRSLEVKSSRWVFFFLFQYSLSFSIFLSLFLTLFYSSSSLVLESDLNLCFGWKNVGHVGLGLNLQRSSQRSAKIKAFSLAVDLDWTVRKSILLHVVYMFLFMSDFDIKFIDLINVLVFEFGMFVFFSLQNLKLFFLDFW